MMSVMEEYQSVAQPHKHQKKIEREAAAKKPAKQLEDSLRRKDSGDKEDSLIDQKAVENNKHALNSGAKAMA